MAQDERRDKYGNQIQLTDPYSNRVWLIDEYDNSVRLIGVATIGPFGSATTTTEAGKSIQGGKAVGHWGHNNAWEGGWRASSL